MSPTSYQTAPPRVAAEQVGYREEISFTIPLMPWFRRRRQLPPPDPRVAQLASQVVALQARLAELEAGGEPANAPIHGDSTLPDRVAALESRSDTADARIAEVSTALSNQLHELSGELESSHRGVDERFAALDALTVGRLAASERAQDERLAAFRA